MYGVADAVIVPCGCCDCHHCATWGVTDAVIMLCMVLRALSLCHMGVVAAVIVLHRVSQVLLLCHMILGPGGPLRERAAMYISKKGPGCKRGS